MADRTDKDVPAYALEADEFRYRGRYIPYSGGSAGWYENSGVLKAELGNKYRFFTALDTRAVLRKRFERMAADLVRRRHERLDTVGVPVLLDVFGDTIEGHIHEFSALGVRVRLGPGPKLAVGHEVGLRVQPSSFFHTELALIDGEVEWVKPARTGEGGWHVGIGFRGM